MDGDSNHCKLKPKDSFFANPPASRFTRLKAAPAFIRLGAESLDHSLKWMATPTRTDPPSNATDRGSQSSLKWMATPTLETGIGLKDIGVAVLTKMDGDSYQYSGLVTTNGQTSQS
jgi:hypothetical protein